MDIEKYLSNPYECPCCGSSALCADEPKHPKPHSMTQKVRCSECGEEWRDIYTLTSAEQDEREDEDGDDLYGYS